jgi:membrane protein DedA with SNARE-associated domain
MPSAALGELDYITVGVMSSRRTPLGALHAAVRKSPHPLHGRDARRQGACEQRQSGNEKSEGSKVDFFDGSWVQHILANYGYAAIFIVVMLESAGVPLPGETILVSAAAFAGNKHSLDIRYVIVAAAGGAIFGDNIGFWVGREFGTQLLSRWGYLIGLDERKRKLGQYLFARHGGKIVFFGRFVALLRAFAALLAGTNGLSPLRFLIFNAAGGIVWATVFGVGGYVLGEGIRRIAGPFGWAVLIAAIVFAVLLWRYYKKNEERFLDEAEAAAANDAWQQ